MILSNEDKDASDIPISKTKKKKDDRARQKLGERLVELSEKQLERVGLPNNLCEAVSLACETTAHGARRRQVKYIGSLLRGIDTTPIEKALDDIARVDYDKIFAFKKLETWRDQLRAGNISLINEILTDCPLAERQQLSQLARNAKKEFEKNKGVKASRALFRYLKKVSEKRENI